MKKFYTLFFILVIGVCTAECKKESKTTMSITGDWYLTGIKYSTVKNGAEQVTLDDKLSKEDLTTHFSFFSNGTGVQHPADPFLSNIISFNYTLSNSTLSVKPMFFIIKHDTFTVSNLSSTSMTLTVKTSVVNGSYDLKVLSFIK